MSQLGSAGTVGTRSPTKLRGVLLDVDGTLVLSVDAHARAWSESLAEAGHQVPPERVRPLIGMGGDRVLPELVPGLNDQQDPGKSIVERRRQIFLERYAPGLQAAPGSRELLLRMRGSGLRLVAASSAKPDELTVLLRAAGADDLIETATSSDDAESSKPAPDIVHAALERSGLRPEEVLMLGDTPYDIESATKARVAVVALRCGGFPESTLDGAVAVYDDPAHLLREYDQSPFGVPTPAG
ncbi:MAG: HAD family hydrolase [Chloroflexota bacterium]|nr:HAD family hydrolase [Chloroflexota bacterium]